MLRPVFVRTRSQRRGLIHFVQRKLRSAFLRAAEILRRIPEVANVDCFAAAVGGVRRVSCAKRPLVGRAEGNGSPTHFRTHIVMT